jgi:hypothetical protein
VDIEKYLFENVERLIEEHILSAELKSKETKVQKSNRKTMEKKLQRLNDLYVNGFIDLDKYKADYAELQSQIVDVAPPAQKKDLAALKEFLQGNYKEIYGTLSDVEKQAMWRTIIKEIRVSGNKILGIKFL